MSRPKRPDHAIELTAKVGLHQCDPLGVAWHGRYFEWFEEARTELFASRDLDVPDLRTMGHRLYVVDARCRYMAALELGDTIHVTAWFSEPAPLIRVSYDIYNSSNERWSARAFTVLAVTDASGELLSSIPDAVLERLPRR